MAEGPGLRAAPPANEKRGPGTRQPIRVRRSPSRPDPPRTGNGCGTTGEKRIVRLLNNEMREDGNTGTARDRKGLRRRAGARHGPGYDPFGTVSSSISSSPSSEGPERTRQSFRAAPADVAVLFPPLLRAVIMGTFKNSTERKIQVAPM